jgi:hypothetical protein
METADADRISNLRNNLLVIRNEALWIQGDACVRSHSWPFYRFLFHQIGRVHTLSG